MDDGSCYQADPIFGCDCNSEGSFSTTLAALATSEPYTFEGTSNPEASSIDIVLNFTGSGSAWPADLAVTISDPNGQCIAFGGYDSSPDGCTSIGGYQAIWPADWAGTGNGTYSATVDLTSAGLAGTGQWSLALFNGWGTAPEVTYDLSFTLDGVCTVTDEVAGCTQEFSCNYNPDATVDDGSCIQPYDVVYVDEDGDGYGDQAIADWCPPLESWLSLLPGDCDDSNANMYPNAFGTAEGLDNNCNGTIDPSEELPGTCPEDVNQDGTVSVADVLAILAEFGALLNAVSMSTTMEMSTFRTFWPFWLPLETTANFLIDDTPYLFVSDGHPDFGHGRNPASSMWLMRSGLELCGS